MEVSAYRARRVVAFSLDAFVMAGLIIPVVLKTWYPRSHYVWSVGFWVSYGIFVTYSGIEIFTGRSLGKLSCGLRITTQNGQRPGVAQGLLRWFVKYLGVVYLIPAPLVPAFPWAQVLAFVGWLLALYALPGASLFLFLSPRRAAIHDLCAATRVTGVELFQSGGFDVVLPDRA